MPTLYEVAELYRQRLMRRETAVVREMRDAYARSMADVNRKLDAVTKAIDDELVDNGVLVSDRLDLLQMYQQRLEDLALQMSEQVTEYGIDAAKRATAAQRTGLQLALDMQTDGVRPGMGLPSSVSISSMYNVIDEEAVEFALGFAADGSPLADLYATIGPDMSQRVASAVAQGFHPYKLARIIADTYGIQAIARAETIARTEMIRAAREGTRASMLANQDIIKGYQRVCAGDQRVCVVCWALHGQIWPLDKPVASHPNCRCAIIPVMTSYEELTGKPGQIPSPLAPDRDELFDALTPDEQLNVLGPMRYRLWQSGLSLEKMGRVRQDEAWGPVAQIIPVRELV
jgi:SPP1 gp7 family putative phage head morphogenesis protein